VGLADVYQQALEEEYEYPKGWMANWPAGFDRRLGEVGDVSNHKFNRDAMLGDKGIEAREDPDHGRPDGPWNFQSDENISVAVGVDASLPQWRWIGNAKAGVKIAFGKSKGVVVGIGSSHQERLLDIDGLKQELLDAAKDGRIDVGKAVVIEQHIADSGVVVESEGQSAELAATTNADVGPAGTPSLASFAADLNVHEDSREVSQETYPNGFTIAFRVVKLGTRGWWWWKHIVVEGVAPVDDDDMEAMLTKQDYFAPLPGARFEERTRI
jgi:hypothetical protein